MAAGEVGRRREGETADENEKTNVKRRKLEEEEESRILILSQNPSSEYDLLGSASSSSSVYCCSSSEEKSKRRIDGAEFDQTETSWIYYNNFDNRRVPEEEESVNEVESCRVKKQKRCETVKEAEIEDFFQAAEKDVRNNMLECSSKYSFDFEKDEPLDGRYEWVKLNP
ncbi:hypothetical protein Bca4012_094856 [Brassica carinata]|uniref:Cyclin-dependent kinase inhibitor domain-containing protein n=2 Tax=Brassica TaxID=3705 RepID=A0A0D3DRZ8_BRAOL|nr:PREDICTED: cyclin-dependent kinase inhibitor 2 isoform X1 [Brassica oleracea var. oleracea]KAG2257699.1 hypothetical protein Bca52824_076993 [Brassica carinata]